MPSISSGKGCDLNEVGEMTAWACRSDNKISLETSEVSRLQELARLSCAHKDSEFPRAEKGSLYAIYGIDAREKVLQL